MNKQLLMLTACATALLMTPVFAADDFSDITTKVTTPVKTKTAKSGKASDVTIESGGAIAVKVSGPAIEIDSNNRVTVANGAAITNIGTDNAIGVQLDAAPGVRTGNFNSLGSIDLSGSGIDKTAILLTHSGIFQGNITLGLGSETAVAGDGSTGLMIDHGSRLRGNIKIDGSLDVQASNVASTTDAGVIGINIAGINAGNITIGETGSVSAVGEGAEGLLLTGGITGALRNEGTLTAYGTLTPQTGKTNVEAASALLIGGNIAGGIYNGGKTNAADSTTSATIFSSGNSATIFISPSLRAVSKDIEIGVFQDATNKGYSFLNRGSISNSPANSDEGSIAISIAGDDDHTVTLDGKGIFNSGTIGASATSSASGVGGPVAEAIVIGENAIVPKLTNSAQSGSGTISAAISGPLGGTAYGINVLAGSSPTPGGSLAAISNSGTISASATSADTSITNLNAIAINDASGSITNIFNSGVISATATALDDPSQQHIFAADLEANKTGVTFQNTGTVNGDIAFGSGNDVLRVKGETSQTTASITGDVNFGSGSDSLFVEQFGTLTGALTNDRIASHVAVLVRNNGTLNMTNTVSGLTASSFEVSDGGTLGLTMSNAFNTRDTLNFSGPLINANSATLNSGSKLNISYGSFVPNTGRFLLIETPKGDLTIPDLKAISDNFQTPYLYTGALKQVSTALHDELLLNLNLKKVGTASNQIDITGNAAVMFRDTNLVNVLAKDPDLGGAVVTDVTDAASAQAAFSSFAPSVNGATRALAISLTDQATGPVGARQRALRMYAGQDGDATLWGQEFAQNLSQESNLNSPGFKDSGFGFVMGLDGGDPSDGRYGGAFTFFSGDVNDKTPRTSKTDADWYLLSGYTDWRGRGFFLDTQVTGGYGNLTGRRTLSLFTNGDPTQGLAFSRTANDKRGSLMAAGGVSTGAIFTLGSTVITPQVSLDGLTLREEGYTETDGGGPNGDGFDLKVNPYYANSLRGYVGTAVREDLNMGNFFLQPEARIGWRYDFLSGAQKVTSAFAATPTSTFTLTGPDPARGNIVGGGSLAVTTGDWSLGLGYDFQRGTNGSFDQQGMLTLVGRI